LRKEMMWRMKKPVDIDINLTRKSNGIGTHDQIIHFNNGEKRYIQGITHIWENEMVHILDYLGVEYIVNKQNVLFIERFSKGGEGYGRINYETPEDGSCKGTGKDVTTHDKQPGGSKRKRRTGSS
jgi:hypothetical protein